MKYVMFCVLWLLLWAVHSQQLYIIELLEAMS